MRHSAAAHASTHKFKSTETKPQRFSLRGLLVEVIKGLLESTDGQTKMRHMRWDAEGAKALDQPAVPAFYNVFSHTILRVNMSHLYPSEIFSLTPKTPH